ncbi:helix-turn-helix domain-containing protein [Bifidobacterium longum]
MGEVYSHLSEEERQVIQIEVGNGASIRGIGAMLGRSPSSISREIKRNTWFPSNENESYRPYRPKRCLCSISCCGFSHDDFSGLGRACRPRNGLNWMVLVSPPERTGKDYDQHAPSTVYPSFAAERGIRRVDRAENTCQRADGA